ncbi:MAG: HEAT repeat domain-containing protein [Planctomycetota bacterium]|jgi:hypothetical protein
MMRVRTKVWIAIVAVCAGLTVYEIPNAVRVWRFTRGTLRADRRTGSGKLNIPAIVTDRLVATDPEAGDMLRYLLKYSAEDANVEDLADLVGKYPENEFLLGQLAEELTRLGVVDPQAALVIVDRLLKLNAENAHYRYLRGWILLTDPNRPGPEQEALEQFETGHRLAQFYLPYNKYKERLDRLYERAALFWERPWLTSFYMDLVRHVFRSDRLRRRLDEDIFGDLSGSIVKIGDHVIENAYDSETFLAGALLLGPGEGIRLKHFDLPEAEAQQSRLRVAQGRALLDMHGQSVDSNMDVLFNIFLVMCLLPFLFWMAMVFLVGILLQFILVHLSRRKPKTRKYVRAWMLIDAGLDVGSVVILALLLALALLKKWAEGILPGFLVFAAGMFTLWNALGLSSIYPANLARLRRPRLWIAAQCGSLWFTGAVLWTAGRLSVSAPDNLTDRLQYGAVLAGWSVLCGLVWIQAACRPEAFALKRRHRVVLITCWVVFLMVVHTSGLLYAQMKGLFADPLSQYRPLPGATQETYNRVILGQGDDAAPPERRPLAGMPRRIFCAAPKDLRAFIARRRDAGEPIPEQQLLKLLRNCNHDLRPVLFAELADPNAYEVLVIRAEWGDRSVKDRLERIYQQRLISFRQSDPEPPPRDPSSLGELLELAGTLARISDGPEARERFSYLMEQIVAGTRSFGTGPSLDDPRYTGRVMQPFWASLGELPPAQAATLIKSYLRQTRFVDLSADRGRAITLLADLLADGDRELAEEVVGALTVLPAAADEPTTEPEQQRTIRLTRYRDENAPHCLEAVFAHLTAESIPLLLEHLDSDNNQLRAFIVWRVTSLGYKWTDEQLAALGQDSYWKVRMNALFASDTDDLATAIEDKNPLVRTVARMLIQSEAL